MKTFILTALLLLSAAPAHAQFTQEQCYARSNAHRTYLQSWTRNGVNQWHSQRAMWLHQRSTCAGYPTQAQLNPQPPAHTTVITQADVTQFVQTRSLVR
ncbi:MAG: hypothetical protein EBS78_11385 [Altererythrobacter sp.]|nr:hypothetical protein [Altererythrobacter sp.]